MRFFVLFVIVVVCLYVYVCMYVCVCVCVCVLSFFFCFYVGNIALWGLTHTKKKELSFHIVNTLEREHQCKRQLTLCLRSCVAIDAIQTAWVGLSWVFFFFLGVTLTSVPPPLPLPLSHKDPPTELQLKKKKEKADDVVAISLSFPYLCLRSKAPTTSFSPLFFSSPLFPPSPFFSLPPSYTFLFHNDFWQLLRQRRKLSLSLFPFLFFVVFVVVFEVKEGVNKVI